MTYIAPTSETEFFPSLGITETDKKYFNSLTEKNAFFDSLVPITHLENMSYIQKSEGVIRAEIDMKTASQFGYMRYRNKLFENMWFYAYVDRVEYVNNDLTNIYFSIDSVTTYQGIFSMKECFIKRQHSVSDAIGANIASENVNFGEYITEEVETTNIFDEYAIAIFTTENGEGEIEGKMNGGIFDGTFMNVYYSPQNASNFLKSFSEKYEDILSVMMLPSFFIDNINPTDTPKKTTINIAKPYSSLNGYVPRNKKLFCYPYKMLTISNCEGESIDLMYEYFNDLPDSESSGSCTFEISGICSTSPAIIAVPKNYKGNPENFNESILMRKFPICSWNNDGYKAYMAQSMSNIVGNIATAGLKAAGSYFVSGGNIAATAVSLAGSAAEMIGNSVKAESVPNINRGSQSNDIFVGMKKKNFYFCKQTITKNYAMMLDSYFDMFGYSVNQHGIPNMRTRKSWTYVETEGCIIEGNVPSDNAREIEKLFNRGLRFWNTDLQNIGNYSLENTPL